MIIKGSVSVITGSGRVNGVGAATAKLLAKKGSNILINCVKNQHQAEQVVDDCKRLGVDAALFMGDLTKRSVCQELSKFVEDKWGRTDILVNCLGVTKSANYEKLEQLDEEDFGRIFAVNVTAPYLIIQSFQKLLKASGNGAIVNVSSAAGLSGVGSSIAYAAAKGAENTLTLALAKALSPEVRVNGVCPSFIDSSWWEEPYLKKEGEYTALLNNIRQGNLLNKVLTPIHVASTILSVVENEMMTGELIRIDAGAHIGKANVRLNTSEDKDSLTRNIK